jgi:hypothetical protein
VASRGAGRRRFRLAWFGIALVAFALGFASSARADEDRETPPAPLRWRFGVGLGGSWLPIRGGGIAMGVARASAGLDYGWYSLRASPAFQYGVIGESADHWTISLGYLALENVFRITPDFAMSVAPLAGYGHSPNPRPKCTDVCTEPIGNGLALGADVSPATVILGDDREIEIGIHADIFVFPSGNIWPGAYLEFRWFFASTEPASR